MTRRVNGFETIDKAVCEVGTLSIETLPPRSAWFRNWMT